MPTTALAARKRILPTTARAERTRILPTAARAARKGITPALARAERKKILPTAAGRKIILPTTARLPVLHVRAGQRQANAAGGSRTVTLAQGTRLLVASEHGDKRQANTARRTALARSLWFKVQDSSWRTCIEVQVCFWLLFCSVRNPPAQWEFQKACPACVRQALFCRCASRAGAAQCETHIAQLETSAKVV